MKIHEVDLAKEHRLQPAQALGHWIDLCSFSWLLLAYPQGLVRCKLGPGKRPETDFWPMDLFPESGSKIIGGSILPSGNWTLAVSSPNNEETSIYWSSWQNQINQSRITLREPVFGLESTEYGWAFHTPRGLRHSDLGGSWDALCPFRGSMSWFSHGPVDCDTSQRLLQSSVTPNRYFYTWRESPEERKVDLFRCPTGPLRSQTPATREQSWELAKDEHLLSCHPFLPLAIAEGPQRHRILRCPTSTTRVESETRRKGLAWCWTRYGVRHVATSAFQIIAEDHAGGFVVVRHDDPTTLYATDHSPKPRVYKGR
jgi:hypothetical protein